MISGRQPLSIRGYFFSRTYIVNVADYACWEEVCHGGGDGGTDQGGVAGGDGGSPSALAARFARVEPRRRARAYLRGLLGDAERKNGWQIAEHLGEQTPDGVQRLLSTARWDADAVRDDLRTYVVGHLGDPAGVLIVDETGFLKQGVTSAGVARQYSSTAGRTENCQVGVFLAYAAPAGCAFLDRALYLPEEWASASDRRRVAGIPEAVAWVVGDTVDGGDDLRRWLEGQGRRYALAVAATHGIWTRGEQVQARLLADTLPAAAWARLSAGAGSQGPRWYDWACLALPYAAAEGWAHWLLVRRSVSRPDERAYYRVYAPAGTPPAAMVRAVGGRWQIETAIAEAKGLVGLADYEVRRWAGWHRHITLCLLTHAVLGVARASSEAGAAEKGANSSR